MPTLEGKEKKRGEGKEKQEEKKKREEEPKIKGILLLGNLTFDGVESAKVVERNCINRSRAKAFPESVAASCFPHSGNDR